MAYLKGQDLPAGDRFTDSDIGALLDLVASLRAEVKIYTQIDADVGALYAKAIEERNAAEAEVASLRKQVAAYQTQDGLVASWRLRHWTAHNADVRTALACPTGEHIGTVCTHPTEGATE